MKCFYCNEKIDGTVVLIGENGHEHNYFCKDCGILEIEGLASKLINFEVEFDEIESEETHERDIDLDYESWRESINK